MSPRTRERLLIFGAAKTGKTAAALSIVEMIAKGDSGAQVHWCETDDALYDAEAIIDPLIGSGTLVPTVASNYPDVARFTDETLGKARDDDWVVMDKADKPWTWTREFYVEEVKGQNMRQAVRAVAKKGGGVGWGGVSSVIERSEWSLINDYYNEAMLPLIVGGKDRPKLHLVFITEVKDMDEDDAALKGELRYGVRPTGQKGLPYQMRTLVHLEVLRGQHVFTSAERHGSGRGAEERKAFTNFSLSYLRQKAGWSRTDPNSASPRASNEASQPESQDSQETPSA